MAKYRCNRCDGLMVADANYCNECGPVVERERLERKAALVEELVKAFRLLHPAKNVWRTPYDEQEILINNLITKAEGVLRAEP